jgi:hypothetical protein
MRARDMDEGAGKRGMGGVEQGRKAEGWVRGVY